MLVPWPGCYWLPVSHQPCPWRGHLLLPRNRILWGRSICRNRSGSKCHCCAPSGCCCPDVGCSFCWLLTCMMSSCDGNKAEKQALSLVIIYKVGAGREQERGERETSSLPQTKQATWNDFPMAIFSSLKYTTLSQRPQFPGIFL